MSAVLSRILSMISCAFGRVFQSANSNWMTPIVSSVISPIAARLFADAGIDRVQATWNVEDAILDLLHQPVLLVDREIAAPVNDDLPVIGLDRREEFDAVAEFAVSDLHRDQQTRASASVMPGRRSAA